MIPTEVADIAQALRSLSPFMGFDRSVRWAWRVHQYLEDQGWVFVLKRPVGAKQKGGG